MKLKNFLATKYHHIFQPPIYLDWGKDDTCEAEREHQSGRLANYETIIGEIKKNNLQGDIIEFGTWKGFSLLWIVHLLEKYGILDKEIIGLDGFVGLPNNDGIFKYGTFADACLSKTRRNLLKSKELGNIKNKVKIYKVMFGESGKLNIILGNKKFCLIHIDCDLSSSFLEITKAIENRMADTCHLLFDDYGCDSDLAANVDNYINGLMARGFSVKEHSKTKVTKNFVVTKRS